MKNKWIRELKKERGSKEKVWGCEEEKVGKSVGLSERKKIKEKCRRRSIYCTIWLTNILGSSRVKIISSFSIFV